jgi:hypothetical protein
MTELPCIVCNHHHAERDGCILTQTIYLRPEPSTPYPDSIKEALMAKKKAAKKVKPKQK